MPNKTPSANQSTLHDVAKLSGVSPQTVSRVINNSPDVSIQTRNRVLEAVETLGYQPNLVARSLKTRRSYILEVLTFGVDTNVPRELMESMGHAAQDHGYRIMFSTIPDGELREVYDLLHRLNSRSCDGAIVTAPVQNAAFEQVIKAHPAAPIVHFRNWMGADCPSVVIDQRAGSQMATQHLIDLGHRRIAEISGPLHWHEATIRHENFLATLTAHGLVPAAVFESTHWLPAAGYEAAQRLLDSGQPFSALVVANDYMSLGAILALTERGWRVPEDVSVVGFDDTPEAAFFRPALTTIRQDYAALGQQCIQYLVDMIDHPDTPVHQQVLLPQLIERQSTGAWQES